jgi:AcrR family transcriptional regulator
VAGRPRSAECDRAILDAALSEYAARGLDGMSVDAVAARAGVSKATIYRRYPSKVELVAGAATMACEESASDVDTGSLRGDLRLILTTLRQNLDDPLVGAAKRKLLFDASYNEELAQMHKDLVGRRRERTVAVFQRAIDRGELQPDLDLEFACDVLGAPIFYRDLVMHERVSDEYIEKIVDGFVARYGVLQTSPIETEMTTVSTPARPS